MTPFRNPTPGAEINYNKFLKQERVIIERCFGQVKRRFPILQYVCRVKLENVSKIIIACIVLHNVAKSLGDPDFELVEQDPDEDEGNHENDELPLRQLDDNLLFTRLPSTSGAQKNPIIERQASESQFDRSDEYVPKNEETSDSDDP
ncbi:unnamed protein product [Acanthoscelides obtectus]|uniref:DDE Tnp4 domain-containing protein n=1 Tax=Acanthoscelides obtectus TaxID=200917 RepID=A0A9P0L3C4_ACAOB|nr:unnamed protein product [Acanthoscelides obtectus]CAK1672452.1 hypothetical protein AOBTE_LOCUS28904 [Acanthoscelides obtectus]